MRIQKSIGTLAIILSIVGYFLLVQSFWGWDSWESWDSIVIFWTILYSITVAGMIVAIYMPSPKKSGIPEGRIIAIVPTYNESQEAIEMTIESLLVGTVEIDEIHVIDDGSDIPMEKYEHPQVFCHWHQHMGKRYTQAAALHKINPQSVDFILTVDIGTQLDAHTVEYLLRAMSDPKVKVCTSAVLASNFSKNLITRMQEFNCGVYFMIARSSRRLRGLLGTTPGACSLYRSEIMYFHLDDFLRSGGATVEERRAHIYSAMEGKAIYVPEAVVYTNVPENIGKLWEEQIYRNAVRWKTIPVFLANVGIKGCIFPILNYFNALLAPLSVAVLVYTLVYALAVDLPMLLTYSAISFIFIAYLHSLLFVLARPNWTIMQRMVSWLFITPILSLFTSFFFGVVRYFAFARMREKEWGRRGIVAAEGRLEAYMEEVQAHYDKTQEHCDFMGSICEWLESQVQDLERKLEDSIEKRSTMAAECDEFEGQIQSLGEELEESVEIESAMKRFHEEYEEQLKELEEKLTSSHELETGISISVQSVCTLLTEAGVGDYAAEDHIIPHSTIGKSSGFPIADPPRGPQSCPEWGTAMYEVDVADATAAGVGLAEQPLCSSVQEMGLIEQAEAELRGRVKPFRPRKERQRINRLYRVRSDRVQGKKQPD